MSLTFGSLFSGIEGFGLGLENAGMRCLWQVEKDKQCLSVLRRHWPDVPKHEDVRTFPPRSFEFTYSWRGCPAGPFAPDVKRETTTELVRPDWICGGFPCQDLSVAGKRAGLGGERSGLWWEFHRIIAALTPSGVCIENVPGLFSSASGRDLAVILSGLGQLGYGWAYRVFDAQWFGVPQRRRRVFIVGCLGDWRRAGEILFEPESLPWDSPPSREEGARVAEGSPRGVGIGGSDIAHAVNGDGHRFGSGRAGQDTFVCSDYTNNQYSQSDVAATVTTGTDKTRSMPLVTHTLRAEGHDASEDGTGRGVPLVPVAYQCHGSNVGPMGTLRAGNGNETGGVPFVIQEGACHENLDIGPQGKGYQEGVAFTLEARHHVQSVTTRWGVRRLTPRECERLQGFPDDWTRYDEHGNELSDSARYRMLGNAVARVVSEWIGRRILTP